LLLIFTQQANLINHTFPTINLATREKTLTAKVKYSTTNSKERCMNLQNKVVIITGASGGIGEAVAKELDAAGMRLVLTARSQDKLERLASNLQNAKVVPGEITKIGRLCYPNFWST
jgi:predicted amino acid dehydrogenase